MNDTTLKIIEELEKTQHEFWNISHQTAVFMNMLIKIAKSKHALEIGTSNGYSGIWLASALKKTKGKLTTIEFWEKRLNIAIENFKKCKIDDVIEIKQGSAIEILDELKNENRKFDFVFIDANKTEYLKYFEIVDKMLVNGGIITADNVLSHKKKTIPFVEAIMTNKKYQTQILDLPAGLLFARKSED